MTTHVDTEASGTAEGNALDVVRSLYTNFRSDRGVTKIVRGVSFQISQSASVGIVGEAGSGKSLTASSIMRLIDEAGYITAGAILLNGRDLVGMSAGGLSEIRGRENIQRLHRRVPVAKKDYMRHEEGELDDNGRSDCNPGFMANRRIGRAAA